MQGIFKRNTMTMKDRYKFRPDHYHENDWMPKVLLILVICVGGIYFVVRFAVEIDATKLNLEVTGGLILFVVFSIIFYKPFKRLKRMIKLWFNRLESH
jgi:hypothetical protein